MIWHKIKYGLRQLDRKIRHLIREVTGASANIGTVINTYDWIRFRLWDRYDKVNIRAFNPGYKEPDSRMLHASMECVLQFVENNKPYSTVDMKDHNEEAYDAILEIYRWYKWERHREWKRYYDYQSFVYGSDSDRAPEYKKEFEEVDDGRILITDKEFAEPKNLNKFKEERKDAEREELLRMEQKLHEKDKEMLKKLAEHRRVMWT